MATPCATDVLRGFTVRSLNDLKLSLEIKLMLRLKTDESKLASHLTPEAVQQMAIEYFKKYSKWPSVTTGAALQQAPEGAKWNAIDTAMRRGLLHWPEWAPRSLAAFLEDQIPQVHGKNQELLSVPLVRQWAQEYFDVFGDWPTLKTKNKSAPDGSTWAHIDADMRYRRRGWPSDAAANLSSFMMDQFLFANVSDAPKKPLRTGKPLDPAEVRQWVVAHVNAFGHFPAVDSPEPTPRGLLWSDIDAQMRQGEPNWPDQVQRTLRAFIATQFKIAVTPSSTVVAPVGSLDAAPITALSPPPEVSEPVRTAPLVPAPTPRVYVKKARHIRPETLPGAVTIIRPALPQTSTPVAPVATILTPAPRAPSMAEPTVYRRAMLVQPNDSARPPTTGMAPAPAAQHPPTPAPSAPTPAPAAPTRVVPGSKAIWAAAQQFFKTEGAWPRKTNEAIALENWSWRQIDAAMRAHNCGWQADAPDSLAQFLSTHRASVPAPAKTVKATPAPQVERSVKPEAMTVEMVKKWFLAHFQQYGVWPNVKSEEPSASGLMWSTINSIMYCRLKDWPQEAPNSLATFLQAHFDEFTDVRKKVLTPALVREWTKAHFDTHGHWPTYKSTAHAPDGSSWLSIDQAMRHGYRNWPHNALTTLPIFIERQFFKGAAFDKVPLDAVTLRKWALDYFNVFRRWPNASSRQKTPEKSTWASIDLALQQGERSWPVDGPTSLDEFLDLSFNRNRQRFEIGRAPSINKTL